MRFFFLLLTTIFILCGARLTNIDMLRRQYNDFLRINSKVERDGTFERFVHNLGYVEDYNKQNTGCRLYLTQHSDEVSEDMLLMRCRK